MIAVIFEVVPHADGRQRYLDIAASLRPSLEEIDGFISIERFQSLSNPEKVLSLSFFRDEEAVARWRQFETHRAAQTAGRTALFADYRLRIAHVVRDYGMHDRAQVPADEPQSPTSAATAQTLPSPPCAAGLAAPAPAPARSR